MKLFMKPKAKIVTLSVYYYAFSVWGTESVG